MRLILTSQNYPPLKHWVSICYTYTLSFKQLKFYLSSCKGGLPLSIRKSKVIKNLANYQILSRYLTEKWFWGHKWGPEGIFLPLRKAKIRVEKADLQGTKWGFIRIYFTHLQIIWYREWLTKVETDTRKCKDCESKEHEYRNAQRNISY